MAGLSVIGAGLAVIGAGLGIGLIGGKGVEAIGRQPGSSWRHLQKYDHHGGSY